MAIDFLPRLFRQERWHPTPIVRTIPQKGGGMARRIFWLVEINIPDTGDGYRIKAAFSTQAEAETLADSLNQGGASVPSDIAITPLKNRYS
jgi:hypothetical protein